MLQLFLHVLIKLSGGIFVVKKRIYSKNAIIRLFNKYLFIIYIKLEGSYVGINALISSNINLPHGMKSIFISGGATIGENCTIYQQVTIGSNLSVESKGFGFPKIGNNCIIGAGAKIIGNVTIGDNCRIGANAVVVVDIPSNTTVVLDKPRFIYN